MSNVQLLIDLHAAEGLEMSQHLQPWHVHMDICHHCKQKSRDVGEQQQ